MKLSKAKCSIYMNNYFMVEYIFSKLNMTDLNLQLIHKDDISKVSRNSLLSNVLKLRILPFYYIFMCVIKRFLSRRNKRVADAGINIFFAIEDLHFISMLLSEKYLIKNNAIWLWNPTKSLGKNKIDNWLYLNVYLNLLRLIGVDIWTFDINDASKYKFKYHNQIYTTVQNGIYETSKKSMRDFFFVGNEKGRLDLLLSVEEILGENNVSCDLYLKVDRDFDAFRGSQIKFIKEDISYSEYLSILNNHHGLIDIVQKGQVGLTLRILEALFYGKKVITNNTTLKKLDIYKKENIFVFDKITNINKVDLLSFLTSEFSPYDSHVLKKYDLEHLLRTIINEYHL